MKENTITVFWTDNGCTPDDVEYVVSVTNSAHSDPEIHVTNYKNITLNVTEVTLLLSLLNCVAELSQVIAANLYIAL